MSKLFHAMANLEPGIIGVSLHNLTILYKDTKNNDMLLYTQCPFRAELLRLFTKPLE